MYDTLAPRSAVNPITLFVLWQRLETPALFSQSIYPPVKLLSRCGRLSGGSSAPSHLYWTGSQGSAGTLRLIDCTFLCLSTNIFSSLSASSSHRCLIAPGTSPTLPPEQQLCFGVLLCYQSEIKAEPSGLGVGAKRPWHLPFTPRRVSPRLARHIPQQRELPRVIIHQNEAFMAHQNTMKVPEWKERSQREVTANTPDAD